MPAGATRPDLNGFSPSGIATEPPSQGILVFSLSVLGVHPTRSSSSASCSKSI